MMFFGFLMRPKMFLDEFMKPKFYKRCKSTTSVMKIRLDAVRRKRNAVIKFLKTDITDLLKSCLDYNAYTKTEVLLEEKKRLTCYDLIERFCDCIFANLSLMLKQKECPEECKEAVSSLTYAAARVPEVPELKDLRSLFAEKYGNFSESYVNQEIIEKLDHRRPSREEKIQTMREIAREFSISWDSMALQEMLLRQSSVLQIAEKDQSLSKPSNDQYTETKKMKKTMKLDSSSEDESVLSESWRGDSLQGSSSTSSSCLSEDETDTDTKKTVSYRFIPPPYTKPGAGKDENPQEKKKKNTDRTEGSARRRLLKPQGTENPTSTSNNEASSSTGFRDLGFKNDGIIDSRRSENGMRDDDRRSPSFQRWKLPDYDELVARISALRRR